MNERKVVVRLHTRNVSIRLKLVRSSHYVMSAPPHHLLQHLDTTRFVTISVSLTVVRSVVHVMTYDTK